MASTTKIATAISVIESGIDVEKVVKIPASAVGVEGSSVYLKEGDAYSIKELLFGLMLRSGNDCAVALAECVDGNVAAFSSRMNATAQKAGALHTRFNNPHGLPDKNHYTTATDLSLITAYALENPLFAEIVATKFFEPRHWQNKNKLLFQYDGAIGVKTGYTKAAGRCLVSAAERGGMKLVCTVLNCSAMYERCAELLTDSFSRFTRTKILEKGAVLEFDGGRGIADQDYFYPLSEGEQAHLEIVAKPARSKENKKIVGEFQIYLTKRLLFSGNLYKL
jgi:D-alanyl-D-alanine carboxypeptidase (penicillin-binding protein 5/6)